MKQIKNIKKKIEWEKYYDPKFNWDNPYFYTDNTLSEDFIREFKDKVSWKYISQYQISSYSRYQKLSKEFLKEFKDKIHWHALNFKMRWKSYEI